MSYLTNKGNKANDTVPLTKYKSYCKMKNLNISLQGDENPAWARVPGPSASPRAVRQLQ